MTLLPSRRDSGPTARGQAMVEFALVLPLLALLLVMAIDFGRVFFGWVALHNASRIAADFAASHTEAWAANEDRYRLLVRGDLEAINCFPPDGSWDDADIPDPDYPSGTTSGSPTVVSLECEFDLITPLASSILGGPVRLAAESSFPVHKTIQQPIPPGTEPEPSGPNPDPSADPDVCAAPVADFTWSPVPARKNQVTSFTDTSSVGTCTLIAWSWDFDPGSSSQQHPTHTFTWPGQSQNPRTFDVELTITTSGGVDSIVKQVQVQP